MKFLVKIIFLKLSNAFYNLGYTNSSLNKDLPIVIIVAEANSSVFIINKGINLELILGNVFE